MRTRVIFVERVRGWDRIPSVSFQSYLHPRLKLTTRDDYSQPLSVLFAERAGVVPCRSLDEFSAIAADKPMAAKLDVRPGSPLLLRKRVVYDTHDKAIEFALVTYRSEDADAPPLSVVLPRLGRAADWERIELTRLDRAEIERSIEQMVNKLLHPPLEALRDEAREGAPHGLREALRRLFRL